MSMGRTKRPLCRFYFSPGGTCKFGDNCSFSHELPVGGKSAACKAIPCKHFFEGVCRYGPKCHFSHDQSCYDASIMASDDKDDDDENTSTNNKRECCICMENIEKSGKRFGLLSSCDHCFCIDCVRNWRKAPKGGNVSIDIKNALSCPNCRKVCKFVVPSKTFHTGAEKEQILEEYLKKLSTIECRHFNGIGSCPFGPDCFYAHLSWDGDDLKPNDKKRGRSGMEQLESLNLVESVLLLMELTENLDDVIET